MSRKSLKKKLRKAILNRDLFAVKIYKSILRRRGWL